MTLAVSYPNEAWQTLSRPDHTPTSISGGKSMKAVVVEQFKQRLKVKEVAEPKLRGPFDAIVRIHASGVCHTDLHAADGDWPVKPALPFIPGHEGVGIVEEVGSFVTNVKP